MKPKGFRQRTLHIRSTVSAPPHFEARWKVINSQNLSTNSFGIHCTDCICCDKGKGRLLYLASRTTITKIKLNNHRHRRSQWAWVCGCSPAGIAGSSPVGGMDVLSIVSVVCCQLEVPATSRDSSSRGGTECGVTECDREASIMRRTWLIRGCWAMWEKKKISRSLSGVAVVTKFSEMKSRANCWTAADSWNCL